MTNIPDLSTIISTGVSRYQQSLPYYARGPVADVEPTTPNLNQVSEDRQRELCLSCSLPDCAGVESSACPIRIEARRRWSARSRATSHDCPCDCHRADSGHLICGRCLDNHRAEADEDEA